MTAVPATPAAGAWPDLDWRFLLPDPHIGRVWLAPECAVDASALQAIGIDVSAVLDYRVDAAFVDGGCVELAAVERLLRPGALVKIAIKAGGEGFSVRRRLHPWTAWRDTLESRGWEVVSCVYSVPCVARPSGYADLDDRRAVRHLLRLACAAAKFPRTTQIRTAMLLERLGLWQLACRHGFILARTPS